MMSDRKEYGDNRQDILNEVIPNFTVSNFLEVYEDLISRARSILSDLHYDENPFDDEMECVQGIVDCKTCDSCDELHLERNSIQCEICEQPTCPSCLDDEDQICKACKQTSRYCDWCGVLDNEFCSTCGLCCGKGICCNC